MDTTSPVLPSLPREAPWKKTSAPPAFPTVISKRFSALRVIRLPARRYSCSGGFVISLDPEPGQCSGPNFKDHPVRHLVGPRGRDSRCSRHARRRGGAQSLLVPGIFLRLHLRQGLHGFVGARFRRRGEVLRCAGSPFFGGIPGFISRDRHFFRFSHWRPFYGVPG